MISVRGSSTPELTTASYLTAGEHREVGRTLDRHNTSHPHAAPDSQVASLPTTGAVHHNHHKHVLTKHSFSASFEKQQLVLCFGNQTLSFKCGNVNMKSMFTHVQALGSLVMLVVLCVSCSVGERRLGRASTPVLISRPAGLLTGCIPTPGR